MLIVQETAKGRQLDTKQLAVPLDWSQETSIKISKAASVLSRWWMLRLPRPACGIVVSDRGSQRLGTISVPLSTAAQP